MATALSSYAASGLSYGGDSENWAPYAAGKDSQADYQARLYSHQAASTSSVLTERPFPRGARSSGSAQAHLVTAAKAGAVVDIDANNAGNPLACAEYARDIFDHLHAAEADCRPDPHYLETTQRDMSPHMRAILVDWLVEVALEYRLSSDTLHLTFALLDRFLSAAPVPRDQLQLVGIACMWAAAKYEEIYAPSAKDFCFITDNTYTPQQLVEMEAAVLRTLNFRLTLPTPKVFLRRYLQASAADERLHFLASFLCEATAMDAAALPALPSEVAAGCVFVARAMLGMQPWDATLDFYAGGKPAATVTAAARLVADCHRRLIEGASFNAVVDKYSPPKLLAVGRVPPLAPGRIEALIQGTLGCGSACAAPRPLVQAAAAYY